MELTQELREGKPNSVNGSTRLDELLNGLGNLPLEALLLGMAYDGLPVLLNLHDPLPGPLLITGDNGIHQIDFLKFIAQVIGKTHDPNDVQYGVLSPTPEEWAGHEESASCAGLVAINDDKASDFVLSLNAWAHSTKRAKWLFSCWTGWNTSRIGIKIPATHCVGYSCADRPVASGRSSH